MPQHESVNSAINSTHFRDSFPFVLAITTIKSPEQKLEMVKLLFAHGADVNLADKEGNTPLVLVITSIQSARQQLEMIKLFFKYRASVNASNKKGNTPLMLAVKCIKTYPEQQLEMVKLLLIHGGDVHHTNSKAETVLDYFGSQNINLRVAAARQLLIAIAEHAQEAIDDYEHS